MTPGLAAWIALCAAVPGALAFAIGHRGRVGLAAVIPAGLAAAAVTAWFLASRAAGMEGLGYIVLAMFAAIGTVGALAGLALAAWRARR